MELTIRQGTAEDLEQLLALYHDYHKGGAARSAS